MANLHEYLEQSRDLFLVVRPLVVVNPNPDQQNAAEIVLNKRSVNLRTKSFTILVAFALQGLQHLFYPGRGKFREFFGAGVQ